MLCTHSSQLKSAAPLRRPGVRPVVLYTEIDWTRRHVQRAGASQEPVYGEVKATDFP